MGLPWWSAVKYSLANSGDLGSIPGSGRSPGEGNDTHSSVPAWRVPWTGEWQATVHGVPRESGMTVQLNNNSNVTNYALAVPPSAAWRAHTS